MKSIGILLSILAFGCLLGSAPVALLAYPWLPVTVMEFVDLQHDPAPWGTASYHEGREQERDRVERALLLYVLGIVVIPGLGVMVVKRLPWWVEVTIWTLTAIAAFGVARSVSSSLVPGAHSAIVVLIFYIPSGIAIVAAVAACLTLGLQAVKTISHH